MTEATRIDPKDDARHDADPIMASGIAPQRWRLPAQTRLGHVSLQVADLSRSLAYYENVLGLRVLDRAPTSALLGTSQGDTPLVALTELKGARSVPTRGHLGLYHFAILLPDRAALGRFVVHLAESGIRVGASDHLVSEALYLRDPDGLGIEVYADRPRAQWRVVDLQLQMASEPLDLDALALAGGNDRWSGMPAGTTMGHVHLHVGEIAEAAAFYHDALGFDKMMWAYPGALFLAAGGYHHHVGVNTWAGPDAPRATALDARLLEWRIVLPSREHADAAAASLRGAGHDVRADGGDWMASDPWGTQVRVTRHSLSC